MRDRHRQHAHGRIGFAARFRCAFGRELYLHCHRAQRRQPEPRCPVWFIGKPDGEILIDTNSTSWKARRIRRGSPVLIWIGSRSGPAFIGKAEFVNDPAVRDFMIERIPKKYWLAWMGFFGPKRAKFDSGAVVTIRIMIESDLAAGFQSQPGTPAPATPDKTSASASRIQN